MSAASNVDLLMLPRVFACNVRYAVAICKGGIFFIVLGIMLVVDRLPGNIGRAAIWSVFSTQSNDFALGLPIFNVRAVHFVWPAVNLSFL
jgi:hypothetical protein